MTGDVDGFADEEQAGHGARLHGARVEAVGVDAACGYFGLSETFRAGGMKLPVVQPAFAGLEGGGGPAIGGGDVNQSICEALWEHGAQGQPQSRRVTPRTDCEEGTEHFHVGREIDEEPLAGLPIRRCLQHGGAAEAAMGDEEFFAKLRLAGLDDRFG